MKFRLMDAIGFSILLLGIALAALWLFFGVTGPSVETKDFQIHEIPGDKPPFGEKIHG